MIPKIFGSSFISPRLSAATRSFSTQSTVFGSEKKVSWIGLGGVLILGAITGVFYETQTKKELTNEELLANLLNTLIKKERDKIILDERITELNRHREILNTEIAALKKEFSAMCNP